METKNLNVEIPENVMRKAKAEAALHGLSLKDYVISLIKMERGSNEIK